VSKKPTNSMRATRREAREQALEFAYEAHTRGLSVAEMVATLAFPPEEFAIQLLTALEEVRTEVDEIITATATGWPLSRMPVIDLLVLRLGVAEMMQLNTPRGVILSEAVDLASRFSTDESGRFVNGVLAAIDRKLA